MDPKEFLEGLNTRQRSPKDNISKNFLEPALKICTHYRRNVAWFRQSAIGIYAPSLRYFIDNDAKIDMLISITGQVDKGVLQACEKTKDEDSKRKILLKFGNKMLWALTGLEMNPNSWEFQHKVLINLLAQKKLEIRFAFTKPYEGAEQGELFHEKAGYIKFYDGNSLAFIGNYNEAHDSIRVHGERVHIFKSTNPNSHEDIRYYINDIDKQWDGNCPTTEVHRCNSKTIEMCQQYIRSGNYALSNEELIKERKEIESGTGNEKITKTKNRSPTNVPLIPEMINGKPFKLRRHQEKAYDEWRKRGDGILWHATGSGKTITSLYSLSKLSLGPKQKIIAIIQIPTTPLADQWVDQLKIFNLNAIECYGPRDSWYSQLKEQILFFKNRKGPYILPIIVLDRTYSLEPFQECLEEILDSYRQNVFYICDECHRFAKKDKTEKLPNVKFKMGLSGSPFYTNNQDSPGDEELLKYFGDIIDEKYEITQALTDKVLTPYDYFPIKTFLNDEEFEDIKEIELKMGQSGSNEDGELSEAGQILAGKRNRILATTEEKLKVFKKTLEKKEISLTKSKTLFFVGDGSTEVEFTEKEASKTVSLRMLDSVKRITNQKGYISQQFTCDETKAERKEIIKDFSNGVLDALIAIRVLDEGIDIPGIRTAFLLASSANRRQYVQRRGRILRRADDKNKSFIYDFIVLPPNGKNCSFVKREVFRLLEIGKDCDNKEIVKNEMKFILENYDINDDEIQKNAKDFLNK